MELFSRNGQLETSTGQRFKVKGISFFGFDCPDGCFSGLWAQNWKYYLDMLRLANFNLVRIPIAIDTALALDVMKPTTINFDKNQDLVGLTSGQVLDKVVSYCASIGILVLFDNHKLYANGAVAPLWYDERTSEATVIKALEMLAHRYLSTPSVIGFDAKNEPWDPNVTWGDRTVDGKWSLFDFAGFCERLGDALHVINPRLLLFVEGLPWGPNKTNWANWGSNLEYVQQYPVELKVVHKVVYAPHVYPPGIAKCTTTASDWQKRFGYIKDMKQAALIIGEHGCKSTPGTDRDWQDDFASWLVLKDIDSIYWCLNSNCADTSGYLVAWGEVDSYKDRMLRKVCPQPSTYLNPKPNVTSVPGNLFSGATIMSRFQLYSYDDALWTPDGKRFNLKGASWFGMETPDQSLQGLWQVSMEHVLDFLAKNRFNFLRIPFSAQLVLQGLDSSKPTNLNPSANPALANQSSGAQLDRLFDLCTARGIGVKLDLHRHQNSSQSPLWYTDQFPESKVVDAWRTIVERFKNKPSFLAADLFNEPQGGATWDDDPKTGWKAASERIAEAILKVAPHLLIGVQGVGGAGPDGNAGWWGGNIFGHKQKPVKLSVDKKLFFNNHVYGPSVYAQPYFSSADFPKNMPAIWDSQWGSVKGPAIALGEWGGWGVGNDRVWHNALVDYLIAKKRTDSFYWCVPPTSGDTGGILENDWSTPVTWKMDLLSRLCPSPTTLPTPLSSWGSQTTPAPSKPQPAAQIPAPASKPQPTPSPTPQPTPQPAPAPAPAPAPVPAPAPAPAPAPKPVTTKFGVALTVGMHSQYMSHGDNKYQYNVTLKNTTKSAIHNIYLASDNTNIVQFWNCEYSLTNSNGQKVFSFPNWAAEHLLQPNNEITYGIVTTKGQASFSISKVIT